MQDTTEKLCCNDVFSQKFVRTQKSGNHFLFQQDSAPLHQAKLTVEFLQRTVPNFIDPSVWSPNSPDLNPVDYTVWGSLHVSRSGFQFGRSQGQSVHLLGES